MSKYDDNDDVQDEQEESKAKPQTLHPEVERRLKELETPNPAAQLLADPDVRNLLAMKQAGKKFQIVEGDPQTKTPPPEDDLPKGSLEDMSNTDLVKFMQKSITTSVSKIVNDQIAPLNEKLNGVSGFVQNTQAEGVKTQIQKARDKYEDFDSYRQQMIELNSQAPGLTAEELYIVVTQRSGKSPVLKRSTESERGTHHSARSSTKKKQKQYLGGAGFSQLLDESLKGLEVGRTIDDDEG